MRLWLAFCGGLIFLAFTCWLGTALLTGGAIMNTQFQWLLTNPYLVEMIKQLFRHALRQINGAVVREAARLGIRTPANETLLGLVKTLEESYRERIKG